MKKILLIFIVTTFLSSCGIYTNYQRPQNTSIDSLYTKMGMDNVDSMNIGQLHWREIFTDNRLQTLIEQGLKNNNDLQIARFRIKEAEAALMASRWSFIPSFSIGSQGTISSFDGQKASKIYQIPITASWQVDIFGSLRNARKRAKVLLESSHVYRQAVQTQLIASIAGSYYQLVLLDEQLKVSEETAEVWRKNVRIMQVLMETGEYNDAAVSQSEANYNRVYASVLDLLQQIHETKNTLSLLLGEPVQTIQRGTLDDWQPIKNLSAGIPLSLLSQRPDVMQAEQNLASAFYSTNEARSAFYPSLILSGSAGWTNNIGTILNPGKLLLEVVGSLTQPVLQNGRLRANLKIARAQQEEARLGFSQALLNAGTEVNNTLTQVQTFRSKAEFYERQVSALKRTVKSTNLLMQNGTITYLEVLTAQEDLLSAELDLLTNRYNEIVSVISLYQSLGGGRE